MMLPRMTPLHPSRTDEDAAVRDLMARAAREFVTLTGFAGVLYAAVLLGHGAGL